MEQRPPKIRMTPRVRAVLAVIADASAEHPVGGYQICEQSGSGPGAVYPILERLEDAKWIVGEFEQRRNGDRPRRRLYTLTGLGAAEYTRRLEALRLREELGDIACHRCGKKVTIRADGMLRTHTGQVPAFAGAPFNKVCDASGTLPGCKE